MWCKTLSSIHPSLKRVKWRLQDTLPGTYACTRNVLTQDIHTASPGCKYVPKTHWHNPEIAPAPIGLQTPHWEPGHAAHSVSKGRGYFGNSQHTFIPGTLVCPETHRCPPTHMCSWNTRTSMGHTYLLSTDVYLRDTCINCVIMIIDSYRCLQLPMNKLK